MSHIVQIIQPQGEWVAIDASFYSEAGELEYFTEPVIAWALVEDENGERAIEGRTRGYLGEFATPEVESSFVGYARTDEVGTSHIDTMVSQRLQILAMQAAELAR